MNSNMIEGGALFIVEDRASAEAIGQGAIALADPSQVVSFRSMIEGCRVVNLALRDQSLAYQIADAIRIFDAGKRIRIAQPANFRGVSVADRLAVSADKGKALSDLMTHAIEIEATGILRPSQIKRLGVTPGFLTRIEALDRLTNGIQPGLYVLSGIPGAGKSTLASQLLLEIMDQGGKAFAFSGELSSDNFMDWMISQASDPSALTHQRVAATGFEYDEVNPYISDLVVSWLDDRLILYDNESASPHIDRVLGIAENLVYTEGVKVVLIDNLMSIGGDVREKDYYRRQAEVVAKLKAFSRSTNTAVILVAHPKKSDGSVSKDDVISGSKEIINWADYVFMLESVDSSRKALSPTDPAYADYDTDLWIVKNRATGRGLGATIPLFFDPATRRFSGRNHQDHEYGWVKQGRQLSL